MVEGAKKKDKKGKEKRKGKEVEEEIVDSSTDRKEGKIDKKRKGRKSVTFADSYPFDPAYRDDCVADALKYIFDGLEAHIADKPFYPRYVAHAVSRTVAQMVQMVCYSNTYWMHSWKSQQGGGAPTEWDIPEMSELPPIDTWARAVIPMKQSIIPVTCAEPLSLVGYDKKHEQSRKLGVDSFIGISKGLVRRRASETNNIALKMGKGCRCYSTCDIGEVKRRNSEGGTKVIR